MNTDTLDKLFAYKWQKGGSPIRTASKMIPGIKLECLPIAQAWQDAINENWWGSGFTGEDPDAEAHGPEHCLINRLLELGGHEVCIPGKEPDANTLLERGQLWYGDHILLQKGEPNECHRNSAYLWDQNKNCTLDGPYRRQVALATGYALSQDGMWRQHSWLMLRSVRSLKVVETTRKNVAYFGFVMDSEEARLFSEQNTF